jgi:hypothetical protein
LLFLMVYGQKFQSWMILNDISKSLSKLKTMREVARTEAIDYISSLKVAAEHVSKDVDKFLEYFTIMPVDLDPSGIVTKINHIIRTKDERVRSDIRMLAGNIGNLEVLRLENILEAATALNMIYKVVRHFYLMGKRTTSMFVLIQLQMVMPILLQEAEALKDGIEAFKRGQPIGDGIGPMVLGKMMILREKKIISRETVLSEDFYEGRKLYLIKAEGPGGTVGRPGEAVECLIREMQVRIDLIITIDAALKLEGEKSGDVAEGIGSAIGGIGVERYQIEGVATRFNIPLYAIIIKESVQDAVAVMTKEICESFDVVLKRIHDLIESKSSAGNSVLIIGVGNTIGISQ